MGLKAALRFDPARRHLKYGRNGGDPFQGFVADIMARRVNDYFRSKAEGFSDRRYVHAVVVPVGNAADTVRAAHASEPVQALIDADEGDLAAAARDMGEGLSVEARATLADVVTLMARGLRPKEVHRATGISPTRQRQRLDALREEIAAAGVVG